VNRWIVPFFKVARGFAGVCCGAKADTPTTWSQAPGSQQISAASALIQATFTSLSRRLNQPQKERSKILDLDSGANNEIIRAMFDNYDPAESRQNKRQQPGQFPEHRKNLRIARARATGYFQRTAANDSERQRRAANEASWYQGIFQFTL
jgi:hypothetical protein